MAVVGHGVALLLALDDDDDRPASKTVIVKTDADATAAVVVVTINSNIDNGRVNSNSEPVAFTNAVALCTGRSAAKIIGKLGT